MIIVCAYHPLSINEGLQPGLSCVAWETVGIKFLLNIISSISLARNENKFTLKSPVIIKFSLGNFCYKASTSLLNNSLSPLGSLYLILIVIGFTVLVTSINKEFKLG